MTSFENELLTTSESLRTWVVHKPIGVISSKVADCKDRSKGEGVRATVYDTCAAAGFPEVCNARLVGRLDADTSGVMVLTENALLDHHLRHPLHVDERPTSTRYRYQEKCYMATFWHRNPKASASSFGILGGGGEGTVG